MFKLHNMCGQQRNSPMADPIFGSKYGPQNGVQNWITFSFLLLGLCLGPVLGSRFGPKSGVSHRRILLLPAEVLQADLRRTSMSVNVNTCFFSLCVPFVSCTVVLYSFEPVSLALSLCQETRDLFHQQNRKGKIVMTKTSRYKGLVLGSFLAPEIDIIFGDGVGASLVRGPYWQFGVGLMRFYIGTAQLKKVLG